MPPTIGSQLECVSSPPRSDDQESVFPIILEFLKQKGLSKTVSVLSQELKECATKNENSPVTKLEELFRVWHESKSNVFVESSHQQDNSSIKPQSSEEITVSDKQHVNFEDLAKGLEQLKMETPDPKHKAKQFQKKKALSFTDTDVEFVDNRQQSDDEDVPQHNGLSFTDLLRLEKASKAALQNGQDDPELSDKLYGTSYESLESAVSNSREFSAPVSASSSRSQSISRSSILRSRSESIGSTRSSKSVSFVTTSDDSASGSGSDSEEDKNGKVRRTRPRRKHKRKHIVGKSKISDESESSSDEDSDIKKMPAEDFFYSSEDPEEIFLFEDARETHSHSSEDDLEEDEGHALHNKGSPPPSDSEEEPDQWDPPSDEDLAEIPKEVQPHVQMSEPLNQDNNNQTDNEEDSALDEIVRDHIQLQRDEYYQELDTKEQPTSLRSSQSIHDSTHSINHDVRHYEDDLAEVSPDVLPAKDNVKYDSFELPIIYVRNRTGLEESKDFPIIVNSVVAGRYLVLSYIGSAAFSKAVKCKDLQSGQQVCIKIIKNNKEFFDQSLDEIKLLKYINSKADPDSHHVLRLYDYFYHKEHLFIVSELLQDNLYVFYKQNRESGEELYFTLDRLKIIAKQILEGLEFIHGLNLIHCDLKPENVLIKSFARCEVKIIDFGSSCFTADDLSSYVQSRSYRAPEVILGLPYNQKIDVWSLGCILAELWCGKVLFHNDSIPTLLARMIGILGNFDKDMLEKARHASKYFAKNGMLYERAPGKSGFNYIRPKKSSLQTRLKCDNPLFVDFVSSLLTLRSEKRPTASEALRHPFLQT